MCGSRKVGRKTWWWKKEVVERMQTGVSSEAVGY